MAKKRTRKTANRSKRVTRVKTSKRAKARKRRKAITRRYEEAEAELRRARQDSLVLRAEAAAWAAQTREQLWASLHAESTQLLEQHRTEARVAADGIRAAAHAESRATLAEAALEAERLVRQAEGETSRIRHAVLAERDRVRQEAYAERARLIDAAAAETVDMRRRAVEEIAVLIERLTAAREPQTPAATPAPAPIEAVPQPLHWVAPIPPEEHDEPDEAAVVTRTETDALGQRRRRWPFRWRRTIASESTRAA
ncbi:MAG: hypothetical protein E6G60_14730 [Actinobacteria bacterium]|nr:MAG: hypothetical protein E6G60_14730 [Actinomycetota bacterium]